MKLRLSQFGSITQLFTARRGDRLGESVPAEKGVMSLAVHVGPIHVRLMPKGPKEMMIHEPT